MNCDEARLELTSVLRGELGSARAAEVQRHLGSCGTCREELAELEDTIALTSAWGASQPSSELRASVLGAVEAASLSSLLSIAVKPPPARLKSAVMRVAREGSQEGPGSALGFLGRRRAQVARVLAAAAILVAGVALGSAISARGGADKAPPTSAGEVPEGHQTQVVELTGSGPATAAVRHYRHDNFRVTISVQGFEPTPAGFHYAVWVRGDRGDVAIGTFRLKGPDNFDIAFAVGVNPSEYPELVVTLEPNDGDPKLTGDVVTRGSFDPDQVQHGRYDE